MPVHGAHGKRTSRKRPHRRALFVAALPASGRDSVAVFVVQGPFKLGQQLAALGALFGSERGAYSWPCCGPVDPTVRDRLDPEYRRGTLWHVRSWSVDRRPQFGVEPGFIRPQAIKRISDPL